MVGFQRSVNERKNLFPPTEGPEPGLPPTRRAGGARHEVSERVHFFHADGEMSGWALNVSRSGVRVVLEERVTLGAEFSIALGDGAVRRPGRIVWIQEEPDGTIVGVSFIDDAEHPPWPIFDEPAASAPASHAR